MLFDDLAFARVPAEDGERHPILPNTLVFRRRERDELSALDVVALAEVWDALERWVELLLGRTDTFVSSAERRLVLGALLLFPRSHDAQFSPGGPPDTHR